MADVWRCAPMLDRTSRNQQKEFSKQDHELRHHRNGIRFQGCDTDRRNRL